MLLSDREELAYMKEEAEDDVLPQVQQRILLRRIKQGDLKAEWRLAQSYRRQMLDVVGAYINRDTNLKLLDMWGSEGLRRAMNSYRADTTRDIEMYLDVFVRRSVEVHLAFQTPGPLSCKKILSEIPLGLTRDDFRELFATWGNKKLKDDSLETLFLLYETAMDCDDRVTWKMLGERAGFSTATARSWLMMTFKIFRKQQIDMALRSDPFSERRFVLLTNILQPY